MTKIKTPAAPKSARRAASTAARTTTKGASVKKSAKSPTKTAAPAKTKGTAKAKSTAKTAPKKAAPKAKSAPKTAQKSAGKKSTGKKSTAQSAVKKGAKALNVKASATQKATPKSKTLAKTGASKTTPKTTAKAAPKKSAKSTVKVKTVKSSTGKKKVTAKKAPVKTTAKAAPKKTAKKATPKTAVKKAAPKKAAAKKPNARTKTKKISSKVSEMAAAMFSEQELAGEEDALRREAANDEKKRDLLERLAVSSDRYDDLPNQELASQIVFHLDEEAISILVSVIESHDDVHAPDAARVVYEVGSRDEELVLPVLDRLIALCCEEHYEMLAFSMYALAPLGKYAAESLWDMRELFWQAIADADTHMQMTQVGAVKLLSWLCAAGADNARTLAGGLVDLLGKCPPNDVAMFAESVLPALGAAHSHRAKPVLDRRMKELTPAEVARLRRAVRQAQSSSYSYAA